MTKRLVGTGLALVVIVTVVWVAPRATGAQGTRQASGRIREPQTEKQHQAWEKGGLPAAAAVTGSYSLTVDPHHGVNANSLDFLVKHSRTIIVGQIVSNRCWLTAKQDRITTDYEVVVEQSLKGQFRPADRLTMSVLGGKVRFKDGSTAEVDPVGMLLPFNGERYVLFLEPSRLGPTAAQKTAAKGSIYAPSFQSLSLFLISPKAWSIRKPSRIIRLRRFTRRSQTGA
jgi:hypothetical protein